jgi:hypothetical protein
MNATRIEPVYDEIWCSEGGLENLRGILKSEPGTPVSIRSFMPDDKIYLMKHSLIKAHGYVGKSYFQVETIRIGG